MSNEGHRDTVARRSKAADLHVGEGGECYIATDTWCYNCGDEGHFGDVKLKPLRVFTGH